MRECGGGVFRVCFISAVFSLLFRIFSEGETSVGRKKLPLRFSGFAKWFRRSRRLGGGRLLELESTELLASFQMGSVGSQEWAEDDVLYYENG